MRGDPYSQAEEMFLRMVFNVVTRNQDDHLSLWIRPANGLCLQPMISASPTTRKVHVTDTHQMSINGKFDDLTREDLLACAAANNIKNAVEIIDKVRETACKWPELAKNCGAPKEMIDARLPHMLLNL